MKSARVVPELDAAPTRPEHPVAAWQSGDVRAPAELQLNDAGGDGPTSPPSHASPGTAGYPPPDDPHPGQWPQLPPSSSLAPANHKEHRASAVKWATPEDHETAGHSSDARKRWKMLPLLLVAQKPGASPAAAAPRASSHTGSLPTASGAAAGTRAAAAGRRGGRGSRRANTVTPWHVRLWTKLSDARDSDNAGAWLLRRGVPMLSAALFVFDVVSDAVLARDLFSNGYHRLATLVLIFMLSHYLPTYLMVLRAANQTFFLQRKMLPTAAAKAASVAEASSAVSGVAGSTAPLVAGMAAVLESLHFFFYVLLVLFGLPLLPLMDAYMVITAVFLPVDTGESGYAMRAADDFCRQYERIRLPLECFMESLPQTGLQVYLYTLTRAGTAARAVQVSQGVLMASLLGSVLNLINVSWELYNAYRASGSTPMEYLLALISLQGYTKVPIEVQKSLIGRVEEHQGRMHDLDIATARTSTSGSSSAAATGKGKDANGGGGGPDATAHGEDHHEDNIGLLAKTGVEADDKAAAVAATTTTDGGGTVASFLATAAQAQQQQPTALPQMLRLLRRGALPPDLVFRIGGPEDSVYWALSSFQRRILMDLVANKVRLDSLRAMQLLQLEPVVAARLLRSTPTLPGLLRLEGDWKPRSFRHGGAAHGGGGGTAEAGTARSVSYLHVVTQVLPDAAWQVDKTSPLLDLQLSALPLTLGSGGAASSLNPNSPYLKGSAAVGQGLAQVLYAQSFLDWLLVDRCDVHAPTMLEAMDEELAVLTRGRQQASFAAGALSSLVRMATFRAGSRTEHAGETASVADLSSAGTAGGVGSGTICGGGGIGPGGVCGRRQRALVVVHPAGSMELEAKLSERAQQAGGAGGGGAVAAVNAVAAFSAAGGGAAAAAPSGGAATSPKGAATASVQSVKAASLMRELHLIPDYIPTGEVSTEAQVVLAPYPRAPGLLDALIPLLSTVLAPKVLDLNAATFSDLRSSDAAAIAACLVVNASVGSLQLRSTGLEPESLKLLLPGVRVHSSLVALDLSLNDLGDAGVAELAAVVCHLPRLNSLMLAKVGMGAAGADALAGQLLACGTHTQLRELGLQDNRDECGTPALEWLCLVFQQRTGKAPKPQPASHLEGSPAVPTFGLRTTEQQPCLDVMWRTSQKLALLPQGKAPDMRQVVMVAATAALAPQPLTLAISNKYSTDSASANGHVYSNEIMRALQNEPMDSLPGFNHSGGTAAVLGAVMGSLLCLSPKNLHELDLSHCIRLISKASAPDPAGGSTTLLRPPTAPVQHLCLGLAQNTTLTVLRLFGCRLDDEAAVALCGALVSGGCPALKRLELHHNPDVRDRGLLQGVVPLLQHVVASRSRVSAAHQGPPSLLGGGAAAPLALTLTFGPAGGKMEEGGSNGSGGGNSGGVIDDEAAWTVSADTVSKLAAAAASGWAAAGAVPLRAAGAQRPAVYLQLVTSNEAHNALVDTLRRSEPTPPTVEEPEAAAPAVHIQCGDSDSYVGSPIRLTHKLENDSQALALALALLQPQQGADGGSGGMNAAESAFEALDLSGSTLGSGGQAAVCYILRNCPSFRLLRSLRLKGVVDSAGDELLTGLAAAVPSLPCLQELDVQSGGGGGGGDSGDTSGFVATSSAVEALLQALWRATLAATAGGAATGVGPAISTDDIESGPTGGPSTEEGAGGRHRRVLRVGPVQPSVAVLRQLEEMSGLASTDHETHSVTEGGAAGRGSGPSGAALARRSASSFWSCLVTSGKPEVDRLCAALLDRTNGLPCSTSASGTTSSQPPQQQGVPSSPAAPDADDSGRPTTAADTSSGVAPDRVGGALLDVAPGVRPLAMQPHHTMALAWAICQQATAATPPAAAATSRPASPPSQPPATTPGPVQGGIVTALLLPASHGGSNVPSASAGGVGGSALHSGSASGAAAAVVLEACRLCLQRRHVASRDVRAAPSLPGALPLSPPPQQQQQAAERPLLLPAPAADERRLAGAVVAVEAPAALSDTDAAALALALLPGDLGREHHLDFNGCQLSAAGVDALLELLPLHGRTLNHLGLGLTGLMSMDHQPQAAAAQPRPDDAATSSPPKPPPAPSTPSPDHQQRLCELVLPALASPAPDPAMSSWLPAAAPSADAEPWRLPLQMRPSVLAWAEEPPPPPPVTGAQGPPGGATGADGGAARSARAKRWRKAAPVGPVLRHLDVCGWHLPAQTLGRALAAHRSLRRVVVEGREEAQALLGTALLPRAPLFLRHHLRDDLVQRNAKSADETSLLNASKAGDLDTVQRLLENPALNPNVNGENGRTSLHLAAYNGHLEVVKVLLLGGAELGAVDEDGDTPLHDACAQGHSLVVEALIWAGADIFAPGHSGRSPLHKASIAGHLEVVRTLLRMGADPDAAAKDGENPLYAAVLKGHMEVIEELLRAGADLSARSTTNYGRMVLHVAVVDGKPDVVDLLLQYGADPNARGEYTRTPLHMAAIDGFTRALKALLKAGADPNLTEEDGETALYIAVRKRHMEVVKALLEVGADLSARSTSNYQRKVLHVATVDGNPEMVDLLLRHGVDPNEQAEYGRTAMHMAAIDGLTSVVEALVRTGGEVNVADENLRTPLHMAAYNGHLETVEALLRAGADTYVVDKEGDTPLHDASAKGNAQVVEALLRAGADADARPKAAAPLKESQAATSATAAQEGAVSTSQPGDEEDGEAEETQEASRQDDDDDDHEGSGADSGGEEPVSALAALQQLQQLQALADADGDVDGSQMEALMQMLRAAAASQADDGGGQDTDEEGGGACSSGGRSRQEPKKLEQESGLGGTDKASADNPRTPLHKAAIDGHVAVMELLIKAGADIEAIAESRRTPLHMASYNNHLGAVEVLLRAGANTSAPDQDEDNPMHYAAAKGNFEIVEAMVKAGADIDALGNNGRTCLHKACIDGYTSIVDLLLQAGANTNIQSELNRTPLVMASFNGHADCVDALLRAGADFTIPDADLDTPLHCACSRGYTGIAEALIKAGSDIQAVRKNNRTSLHMAAYDGHPEVVQILLREGARTDVHDADGDTPLHDACSRGHTKCAELLLAAGADMGAKERNGRAALHKAAIDGRNGVVELLLQAGCDANMIGESGRGPLHYACYVGNLDVVETLLRAGATLTATDEEGDTPLHYACARGQAEVVQALLGAGADLAAKGKKLRTPLHAASLGGHPEVVEVLLRAGADRTAFDVNGKTPEMVAASAGEEEVAELLSSWQQHPDAAAAEASASGDQT